jgi:uncharacterized protein YjbI with pentapeptide repeats
MNIVKSLHASFLHKTFSFKLKHYFSVSLLWGFTLDQGTPVLEQKLWTAIGNLIGKNELFDIGMPKDNAEMLVHGSFFSPGGTPVQGGHVSASLGPIRKNLLVFGDRRWIKGLGIAVSITRPEPFTEMPVDYAHAYGGEDFKKNPIGKGFGSITTETGQSIHPLPNIEYPDQLIGSPGDHPEPAAYPRIDVMWPQRQILAGTYDKKYIRERLPGLPDDIKWSYFNDAAPDQRIEGYFQGTESYEIINMHPTLRLLRGKLPGIHGRCFVTHVLQGQPVFKEIRTKLDTVWFFPSDNLGLLIHRGTLEVNEDDGCDIAHVLLSHENLSDQPRSLPFYQAEMLKRLDPEEGFKYLLNTRPFIPEGCRCGFELIQEETTFPLENLGRRNIEAFVAEKQAESREILEKQKQEIEATLAATPSGQSEVDLNAVFASMDKPAPAEDSPDVKELKQIVENIAPGALSNPAHLDISALNMKGFDELRAFTDKLTREKKMEAESRIRAEIVKLEPLRDQQGVPESIAGLEQSLLEMTLPAVLPRFNLEELLRNARKNYNDSLQQLHSLHAMGVPDQNLPQIDLDMDDMEKKIRESMEKAVDSYRSGAHFLAESRSPHPGREPDIAARLLNTFHAGGRTAGGDYAFIDLAGQDLSGIDLSNAFLEYADLTWTNLSGATLNNAILAHANLSDANLTKANLTGANLGATLLTNTKFIEADLTGAILGKARLSGTIFLRCRLIDRLDMFLDTLFDRADFSGSILKRNNFINATFNGCQFMETDLSESNFVNPVFNDCCLDRAILSSVNFVTAKTHNITFRKASMKNVRFVAGCTLAGAIFIGAEANQANLRDCDLRNADFSTAHLENADFGGSDLTGARFAGTIAVQAQFNKANLSNAILFRANLMEASLHKATLTGARFSGANLYSVNFMGCKLGETDFTDAYLEKTILKKWEG